MPTVGKNEAAPKNAELEKSLSDTKFVTFLAKHKVEATDTEKVERLQGVFETKRKVVEQIGSIYKTEVFQKAGLKFEKADMLPIEEYIEGLTRTDLDQFEAIKASVEQYKSLPAEIEKREREYEEFLNRKEKGEAEIKSITELMEKAAGNPESQVPLALRGLIHWDEATKAEKRLHEEYGLTRWDFDHKLVEILGDQAKWDEKQEILEQRISNADALFRKARDLLFDEGKLNEQIIGIARRRAAQQVADILNPNVKLDVKKVEKISIAFQKVREANKGHEWELFEGMKEEDLEEKLDEQLRDALKAEMKDSLDRITPEKSNLRELENALKGTLKRTENAGEEGSPDREFFGKALTEIIEDPTNNVSDEKKLLVTYLIEKYNLKA